MLRGARQHDIVNAILFWDSMRLGLLGNLLFHQRGFHKAQTNDVAAQPLCCSFLGDDLAKPDGAMLGNHMGRLERRALLAMHAPHENDRTRSLGMDVRQAGFGGEEGAIEMDGEQFFPVIKGKALHFVSNLNAGVCNQDIHATKGGHHGRNARVDSRDIHGHAWAPAGTLGVQFESSGVGSLDVEIRDGCQRTLGHEAFADGFANAAGRTGYNQSLWVRCIGRIPVYC